MIHNRAITFLDATPETLKVDHTIKYNTNKIDWPTFIQALSSFTESTTTKESFPHLSATDQYNCILAIIEEAIRASCPTKNPNLQGASFPPLLPGGTHNAMTSKD
jgi:hypothetical protein